MTNRCELPLEPKELIARPLPDAGRLVLAIGATSQALVVDPLEEVVGLRRGPVGGEERGSELGQRLLPMTFDRHPRDLITRLPDLEREAEEYESRARALRQIVAGVRALNGDAEGITDQRFVEQNGTVFVASPMDDDGPRGRDAVLSHLSHTTKRFPRTPAVLDGPCRDRTYDLGIKSPLLYQLS
jgi:hypothetical protein